MNEYDVQDPYGTYDVGDELKPYEILNQMKSWTKEIYLTVSDGFGQSEAQIAILSDEINLKVSKDGLISAINLTPEAIKISASRIELSGYATFTALSTNGMTSIHGGNIRTDTILANAILVNDLSAISANLGTITAGEIYGTNIYGAFISGGKVESQGATSVTTIEAGRLTSYDKTSLNNKTYLDFNSVDFHSAIGYGIVSFDGTNVHLDASGMIIFDANVSFANATVTGLGLDSYDISDFSSRLSTAQVAYATNAGTATNSFSLGGVDSSGYSRTNHTHSGYQPAGDYSISGHVHSGSDYVKPSSGQVITLGASGATLNVYVSGSLIGRITYD